jgi:hypothetical protein
LRRLADRYVIRAALAVCHGDPVPEAVTRAFAALPEVMARADALAGRIERGVIDLAETVMLRDRTGSGSMPSSPTAKAIRRASSLPGCRSSRASGRPASFPVPASRCGWTRRTPPTDGWPSASRPEPAPHPASRPKPIPGENRKNPIAANRRSG